MMFPCMKMKIVHPIFSWMRIPCMIVHDPISNELFLGKYIDPRYFRFLFLFSCMEISYQFSSFFLFQGEMYAGGLFIQQILRLNVYLSVIVILLITAIYTIGGQFYHVACFIEYWNSRLANAKHHRHLFH